MQVSVGEATSPRRGSALWRAVLDQLSSPAFADEEKTRRAAILNALFIAMLLLLVLGGGLGLLFIFAQKALSAVWIGAALLLLLVARGITRSGHVTTASIVSVGGLWCWFAVLVFVSGGVFSANLHYFISITVLAGLVLGLRGTVVVAGLSSVTALVLGYVTSRGYVPPRLFPVPPMAASFDLVLSLAVTIVPLSLALRTLASALRSARRELEERVKTAAALVESEQRYRSITNSVSEAIFVHEVDTGRIRDVNRSATDMYGFSRDEMLERSVAEMSSNTSPYTQAEALAYLRKVTTAGPQVFEWRARRKDGSLFWCEVSMRQALIGTEHRILAAVRDVSERKAAEQERVRLQEQLGQAQRLESVGRLAGGVAHDFNNLLTGIIGHISLMLSTLQEDDPRHAWMVSANKAASSAADLTRQLLTFSRQQIIEPRPVSINEVVLGMTSMLERTIGESIDLKLIGAEALWPAYVDPSQLEHILLNLAINARDAMPDGGKLTIETANVTLDAAYCRSHGQVSPGEYVMVAVSDTGIGMTPEVSKRIFEPFFSTKERAKGTGLGLAMVFGAVKQHGGAIEVYTEVGQGTTFKIYLKRGSGEAIASARGVESHDLPRGTEVIVLVEDEPVVRELAAAALKRLDYRLRVFASGEEALADYEGNDELIDLLITDVVLRGINGRVTAERLGARRAGLKVLYTSGHTANVIVHHGILEQGVEFLGKPFTPAALAHKVRSILDAPAKGVRR